MDITPVLMTKRNKATYTLRIHITTITITFHLQVISRAQKSLGCPYFATRKSVPLCQLVLLPYQVLLHAATRAAWGVELENNVVVLDEAHNVLQVIGNINSSEISSAGLKVALQLIDEYITTYKLVFLSQTTSKCTERV